MGKPYPPLTLDLAGLTPIAEYADLSDDDRFVLAAGGNPYAQEWMAHRILSTIPDTARALEAADVWARMATCRGHVLSTMTQAQLFAAQGAVAANRGDRENTIFWTAHAIALFDLLAERGERYSIGVTDNIFARLKAEGLEDIHAEVLARAKAVSASLHPSDGSAATLH